MKLIILLLLLSSCTTWKNSIKNEENAEFVNEIAFNKGKPFADVTQREFNKRYIYENTRRIKASH